MSECKHEMWMTEKLHCRVCVDCDAIEHEERIAELETENARLRREGKKMYHMLVEDGWEGYELEAALEESEDE